MFEPRYLPVRLPKLYVVFVDKLPCGFLCSLVVGTDKLDCSGKAAVRLDYVNSILGHDARRRWRRDVQMSVTQHDIEIGRWSFSPLLAYVVAS